MLIYKQSYFLSVQKVPHNAELIVVVCQSEECPINKTGLIARNATQHLA